MTYVTHIRDIGVDETVSAITVPCGVHECRTPVFVDFMHSFFSLGWSEHGVISLSLASTCTHSERVCMNFMLSADKHILFACQYVSTLCRSEKSNFYLEYVNI